MLAAVADVDDVHWQTELSTDEGGHYVGTMLPPGQYRVYAAADADGVAGWEGGQGPHAKAQVELLADRGVRHDVDFERGVTLELRATTPGRLTYYAFPGVELTTWKEASKLLSDKDSESSMVGSTPDDEDAFGVIQGLRATVMTVCAVRSHKLFEPTSYAECTVLPAPASEDATVSASFDPPPVVKP